MALNRATSAAANSMACDSGQSARRLLSYGEGLKVRCGCSLGRWGGNVNGCKGGFRFLPEGMKRIYPPQHLGPVVESFAALWNSRDVKPEEGSAQPPASGHRELARSGTMY